MYMFPTVQTSLQEPQDYIPTDREDKEKNSMKNNAKKKGMAAVICAAMLVGIGSYPVHAGIKIGDIGTEIDKITVPGTMEVEGDVIALDDLGISVIASDYVALGESDGFVYIYTMENDSIPYVIVGKYSGELEDPTGEFTDYMRGVYADLQVAEEAGTITLGSRNYSRIVYNYTVSGYTAVDTRLFCVWNGNTYMFGTKEVPELSYNVSDGILESVAGSFASLAGGTDDYQIHVDSTGTTGTTGTSTDTPSEGSIVFDESVASYQGTWVYFEDGFRLYLPSDWSEYEIPAEQQQQGTLYVAGEDPLTDTSPMIVVAWGENSEQETIEEIAGDITSDGYQVDDIVTINGIECVAYQDLSENGSGVAFLCPGRSEYFIVVHAISYSQNVDLINTILCSLSLG